MRRWTDGKFWSPSRVQGAFLCYQEWSGRRRAVVKGNTGGFMSYQGRGTEQEDELDKRKIIHKIDTGGQYMYNGGGEGSGSLQMMIGEQPGATSVLERNAYGMKNVILGDNRYNGNSDDINNINNRRYGEMSISGHPQSGHPKKNGIMKKALSIKTLDGKKLHIVTYFYKEDIESGRLLTPSTDPDFPAITIPPGIYPELVLDINGDEDGILPEDYGSESMPLNVEQRSHSYHFHHMAQHANEHRILTPTQLALPTTVKPPEYQKRTGSDLSIFENKRYYSGGDADELLMPNKRMNNNLSLYHNKNRSISNRSISGNSANATYRIKNMSITSNNNEQIAANRLPPLRYASNNFGKSRLYSASSNIDPLVNHRIHSSPNIPISSFAKFFPESQPNGPNGNRDGNGSNSSSNSTKWIPSRHNGSFLSVNYLANPAINPAINSATISTTNSTSNPTTNGTQEAPTSPPSAYTLTSLSTLDIYSSSANISSSSLKTARKPSEDSRQVDALNSTLNIF
ncbi:cAMP-independent regulatory protein pac2 [Zancudomyces culisetae]|uniref:cAMP-independent regulatory protein pac2 n=1 Tax=Zancudomyces culisetae TaxID=1213189 RepID=A0A1R1PYN1_ZANCU|nr:cAMP-independent regulatory protein pac2 [Zancudomyces culisetae]|eukprot:OMH86031.1 cAMP-independent regulatory protein pac2 [Zancudomyces culisetae]